MVTTHVDTVATQTMSNKTLDNTSTMDIKDTLLRVQDASDTTKQLAFDVTGTTAITGTIQTTFTTAKTLTLPDITDTVVTKTSTDILTNKELTSPLITEVSAPGTPASGKGTIYVKSTDSNLYFKNDAGTESQLSGGGASVTGSGANTRVAFWTSSSILSSDAELTYDSSTDTLNVGTISNPQSADLQVWGQIFANHNVSAHINSNPANISSGTSGGVFQAFQTSGITLSAAGSSSAHVILLNGRSAQNLQYSITAQTGNVYNIQVPQLTISNITTSQTIPIAANIYSPGASIASTNTTITSSLSAYLLGPSSIEKLLINSTTTANVSSNKLYVNGTSYLDGEVDTRSVIPITSNLYDLGATGLPFRTLYIGTSIEMPGANITTDTGTGMKIGTATNEKIGFYNKTPIVQPTNIGAAITDSTGGSSSTTFAAITAGITYAQADMTAVKNALASTATRLNEIRTMLVNLGLSA